MSNIYSLNTKNREEALYKYPEENVMVGESGVMTVKIFKRSIRMNYEK